MPTDLITNDLITDGSTGFFIFLAAFVGLLVGSFLNVVIHRVPLMLQNGWVSDCCELLNVDPPEEGDNLDDHPDHQRGEPQNGVQDPHKVYNLIKPDSHCPNCNAPIKPWQNIPVLSYLLLKGRCANCSVSISKRYPLIELTTAILSGFIAFVFLALDQNPLAQYSLIHVLAALLLTWFLIALTMIDIDHQLLPDNITLPLLWLGLMFNSFGLFTDLHSAVLGAIGGYLILWLVFWTFKLLTGKEGMGYGDFKLLAALGAWLGWQALPLIILLSSLVGAVIGVAGILIMGRDKSIPIPFGPYLAIAGWIALIWGDMITRTYLQYSGLN